MPRAWAWDHAEKPPGTCGYPSLGVQSWLGSRLVLALTPQEQLAIGLQREGELMPKALSTVDEQGAALSRQLLI